MTPLVHTITLTHVDDATWEVRQSLIQLEAMFHEGGWEALKTSFIAIICRPEPGHVTITPTTMALSDDVPYSVYGLGHAMADHVSEQSLAISRALATEAFYGVCLFGTALLMNEDEPLDHMLMHMRTVMAVDINGIVYDITRLEGEDPEINDSSEHPLDGELTHEGLRLMCLAITRHMDNNTGYVKALMDLNLHVNVLPTCGENLHSHETDH